MGLRGESCFLASQQPTRLSLLPCIFLLNHTPVPVKYGADSLFYVGYRSIVLVLCLSGIEIYRRILKVSVGVNMTRIYIDRYTFHFQLLHLVVRSRSSLGSEQAAW